MRALYVGLDWMPYRSRCALINWDTLQALREIARILFIFDILSGKVLSPPLLAEIGPRVPSYSTRRCEFFQIDSNRTNFGAFEPFNAALHSFKFSSLSHSQFFYQKF
jgi:hypothetical protein